MIQLQPKVESIDVLNQQNEKGERVEKVKNQENKRVDGNINQGLLKEVQEVKVQDK